ncbi:OprD family outer membrane porin [Acinetobacter sp. ANC 5502]
MRCYALWMAFVGTSVGITSTHTFADFFEDSQTQLKFKNFYLDRQYDTASSKNWGSWSQGVTLDTKSGYADLGVVKVGADLLAQYAVRLDGRDRNPDWVLPYEGKPGTGKQAREFAHIGATLKVQVAQTEIRVGELLPVTPVLVYDPSRQLLTTYNGAWLESKDIKNTKVTLGYIKSINARYENQPMDLGLWPKNLSKDSKVNGMYIAGVDYKFNQNVQGSYFYADVDNIYQQNYLGLSYKENLNKDAKLDTHIRFFDNRQSGDALYGKIDNQALSLGTTLTYKNQTIGLGYQQMFGKQGSNPSAATGAPYFPTLAGWVPQPYLDNWGVASFIRKDEQSLGMTYSYNFAGWGINGLKATAKYWGGWNIDSHYESNGVKSGRGTEDEFNFILNYVVPEGKFKGLGFEWMYIDVNWHNVQGQISNLKENRIATTYTYKF